MNLNILTIGYDDSAVDEKSKLAKRNIEYGDLVNKYITLVPAKEKVEIVLSDKAKVFSVKIICKNFFLARFFSLFQLYFFGKKIIKNENINLISVQDPFEFALVAWLLAKKYKIKLHIQEHGDFFGQDFWKKENIINFLRYYLGIFLIKKADSIRVVSSRIKNNLISKLGIDEKKIISVPIFTSIENKERQEKKDSEEFNYLWLGRFVKQKNLYLLIEAFKEVVKIKNNAKLILVGRGPLKNFIVDKVNEYQLKDNVEFVDWTDNVAYYYNLADVYVLPSNYEGWGLVVVESASYGLPIIMTDVGCAGEFVIDQESALVIDVGDKQALRDAMLRLYDDEVLRKNLGDNAKKALNVLLNKEKALELYKRSWEIALEK